MKTKDITITAMLIAILVVCSQLAIPVGPVPITLQTLGVLMIGFLLTPKNALLATSIYAVMGLAGLPVFSGFSGGLQSILVPSFGFVLAFIPAAYIQATYLARVNVLESKHLVISGVINIIITYTIGLPVFSGFSGGLQSILVPSFGFVLAFIPAAYIQATPFICAFI